MKKIITAINNPNLNERLNKEEYIEVIGKDIQYKEAILETLEKNKEIAKLGGHTALVAKDDLEKNLGESVINKSNKLNYKYVSDKEIE